MEKKNFLTRILSLAGTVLVWFPVLFTIFITVVRAIKDQSLCFDYLLPAELFPFALAGSALILWAAFRAQLLKKLVGWNLAAMLASLFGSQGVAVLSGIASGGAEPAGPAWVFILALIALYWITLILMGIAGVLLIKKLRPQNSRLQP